MPFRDDRRRHRYFLRSTGWLCGRGAGQCHDAFLGNDPVLPISDPGNDHQCGDGLQSVQHHVCSGHRILADLRKAYAKRGFECEGE